MYFRNVAPKQYDDATRRFADEPQRGYHLFKRNGVWLATAPGFRSVDETPSKVGLMDGRTGKQDAINQLYGKSRFTSPLRAEGFYDYDPVVDERQAA